jgi:hypothetical protein
MERKRIMSYKFCLFLLPVLLGGTAFAADMPQQIVTSEVFYDYDEDYDMDRANDVVEDTVVEQRYIQTNNYEPVQMADVAQRIPVWPLVGTDADFQISCKDAGCSDGDMKIVSKIGSGLVIENNINMGGVRGTGWSGGPSIDNGRQIPAGFDYECVNNAEMPLLQREMMEDDGGTVLSMSRSARRVCNKQPDAYMAFAERAGFVAEKTPEVSGQNVAGNTAVINVNDDVDDQAPAFIDNEVRSWVVASGQTLQDVLKAWCDKEGWDLVWTTPREYPIEASAVFKGRFVDVASALVRNFERAAPAPYAKFYKGNRVLVISTLDE